MKKITLITIMLGVLIVANAQTVENKLFDKDYVPKNELVITPEIREMLDTTVFFRYKNWSDKELSRFGIKNRAQLENIELGKPIPRYELDNGSLRFMEKWNIHVMSDGEILHFVIIKIENNGQYVWVGSGSGSAGFVTILNNYENKNLIIGILDRYPEPSYFIIRKNNMDIFVKEYDYETDEYFKNEYNFSEIINHLKEN
jgi:hypothetical protein